MEQNRITTTESKNVQPLLQQHNVSRSTFYQGDCIELIRTLPHCSVNLSFWSPPYFVGKEYEKGMTYEKWQETLQLATKAHFPVLKSGGFLVINIADILCFADERIPKYQSLNVSKQKSHVSKEDVLKAKEMHPDYSRYELAALLGCSEQTIDRRINGNNIRGGKHNTQTRVHLVGNIIEQAAYNEGLYLYDRRIWRKDPAWHNSKWHNSSYRSVDEFEYLYFFWKPGVTVINRTKLTDKEWKEWGARAVWDIPSVRVNDIHPAMFPVELPERIIKLLTEEGDTVLDCFAGSGTTGIACKKTGRHFIGIEKDPKYFEIAVSRVSAYCG